MKLIRIPAEMRVAVYTHACTDARCCGTLIHPTSGCREDAAALTLGVTSLSLSLSLSLSFSLSLSLSFSRKRTRLRLDQARPALDARGSDRDTNRRHRPLAGWLAD